MRFLFLNVVTLIEHVESGKHQIAGAIEMQKHTSLIWGLFCLRIGLGLFLALWAVNKLVAAELSVDMFSRLYFININTSVVMILGAIELVLSLLLILGMNKTVTYGLGLLIHTASTIAHIQFLTAPFGKNQLFIATIPILFAFIALFLMRHLDTKWILGRKKSLFS
jgi:putative oxidoreductase